MKEKKIDCKHPEYCVKDGKLVCSVCGEPSPKAMIVDGEIVPIEPEITCPHCGGKLTAKGLPIEDKNMTKAEKK